MKVVLDNNVLISALALNGFSLRLIELLLKNQIQILTCKEILEELVRVLNYPKLKLSKEKIQAVIHWCFENSVIVEVKNYLSIIKEDPSDDIFLSCALEAQADFIITGDKHLLQLGIIQNTKIVSQSKFLNLLN